MPERDDFYVGYMPLPRAHKRFLQITLPLTLFLMVFSAAGIALRQRDPGPAVWQTGEPSTWDGNLRFDPYPTLYVEGEQPGAYLLVRMGKLGAQDIAAPFDNQLVTIRGRQLERDGRRMIELDADDPELGPPIHAGAAAAPPPARFASILAQLTLSGEILDAKCYLGAMKPGDGKAHKACATTCISAGIPPMLFTRTPDGAPHHYILTDPSGAPLLDHLLPFIGEPVTLSGRAETRGSLLYLRVDPASISRP